MKKLITIAIAVVIALILTAGLIWYMLGKPLYVPGMVKAGENLRSPLIPPQQNGNENFWQVEEDIQLYHFTKGNGKNVLVIHGGPGVPFLQPWKGLEPLTENMKFHYYDQRGCGESTRPIDSFSSKNNYENMKSLDKTLGLGAQVADIERIRRLLGDDKLVLIGHSFGGFLASLYAAEFPENVEALILIAPAELLVMPQKGGGLFGAVREKLPEEMMTEYDVFLKEYLSFNNIFLKTDTDLVAMNRKFGEYYQTAMGIRLPEQGNPGGWMVQAMYISMGTRHDYRKALMEVQAPVLVIHGANDIQSENASRVYADTFPNSNFQVIENSTHFPFDEQPQAFSEMLTEFLKNL